jgi:hypothetical protein
MGWFLQQSVKPPILRNSATTVFISTIAVINTVLKNKNYFVYSYIFQYMQFLDETRLDICFVK